MTSEEHLSIERPEESEGFEIFGKCILPMISHLSLQVSYALVFVFGPQETLKLQ